MWWLIRWRGENPISKLHIRRILESSAFDKLQSDRGGEQFYPLAKYRGAHHEMQLIDQSFEQQPVPHTSTPEDNHIAAVFLFYLRHPARCLGPGGMTVVVCTHGLSAATGPRSLTTIFGRAL